MSVTRHGRRHMRLDIADGFMGTFGGREASITLPAYLDYLRIVVDEAAGRLVVPPELGDALVEPRKYLATLGLRRTQSLRSKRRSSEVVD
jgi:hypothetical protein